MIEVNADTNTGMGAIGRMQVVVRCERVSHLSLCTPERQSLCESHRQRRWLTCWSYNCHAWPTRTEVYQEQVSLTTWCTPSKRLHTQGETTTESPQDNAASTAG